MKRPMIACILLLLCLSLALPVCATETTAPTEPTNVSRAPGYCGESIAWDYSSGVLTITGTGKMDDFPEGAPWEEHKNEIHTVIISGGITYVGAWAFNDYDKITTVEFGKDIYEIGERAFFSCDGLTAIYLPQSFKIFGPSSFMGCSGLKEIHCEGRFPTFRLNSTWDTYAVIYFPADRPWGLENIKQYEESTHGRIEFLASDGTDPYNPDAQTQPPTQPPTQPTTEPTQPPTEPPTEPVTTAPTEAETTAPTLPLPEETAPALTEPEEAPTQSVPSATDPEQDPEEEPRERSKSRVGLYIIGGVAAFLILGRILFGGRKRGKYAR